MGYDGFSVRLAEVLDEPAYLSEDVAMPEVIDGMIKKDPEHRNLYVFDRGLASLYAYDSMSRRHAKFVGRIKTNRKMETVRVLEIPEADRDAPEKLELDGDRVVHLHETGSRRYGTVEYRVITAHFKESRDTTRPRNKGKCRRVENTLCFITNDMDLSAKEVVGICRRRWDIEVFFRFLKQELSFSHFLSVNRNGLQVILYMTLITAMLLMIYKKLNGMGYSMAVFTFAMEMEDYLIGLGQELNGNGG